VANQSGLSPGYVESAQCLRDVNGRSWGQSELLRAAEAALLRNTGWPVGLVLQTRDRRPVPTSGGVEFRIDRERGGGWTDYWNLHKTGAYYFIRAFEEETDASSARGWEGTLWFDIRIWRIAEILLHGAALYRELKVPPNEPFILEISHLGLNGREFGTSHVGRRYITPGRLCHVEDAHWRGDLSQDFITANLKSLVVEIASDLFVLFDFADLGASVIEDVVDDFLRSRL